MGLPECEDGLCRTRLPGQMCIRDRLFSFPAPILIAICLNEVRSMRMKKFVQTASYLPYFISWVIDVYKRQLLPTSSVI